MTLIALKQICNQLKEAIGLDDEHNVAALIDEDCETKVKGWTIVCVSNSGEIRPCTSQSFSTIKELMYSWLEKQGEKNPTDKVQPKFKVGDWVIGRATNNEPRQISEITDQCYKSTYGGQYGFSFEDEMRLWAIEDAKAGDVLSYNDGHGNDCIELIKSVKDKKIEFWFCLSNGNRYEVFDRGVPYTNFASREDAVPATKEQRDLLFQKIKEADLEWDADKKELKKIEPKPAWSEKDEDVINLILSICSDFKNSFSGHVGAAVEDDIKKIDKWLKSLRPQSTWKPSEEQMDALETAVSSLQSTALESLYNKLKKL